ncbi:hypothetical protein [Pectinatus haikarae]|uniref:Uncharacterized protein n=1 Tax=Pectinatus haikarae TaxID=349096 RepID=A0ABT9Y7P3_9FIRM|nr:hypothetical protein [Pectinatus haikarae]MDQ0203853.1 hypothetical protein [Pectinatus haikarae]
MRKKLAAFIFSLVLLFAVSASADEQQEAAAQDDWIPIVLGHGNDDIFYFDKTSLHYDTEKNGSINKNIVAYKEKRINRDSGTLENGYYSITDCKINLENSTLLLGEETFYKSSGEKRWSTAPTYLVWYTVKPGTVGWSRFSAVAQYVTENQETVKNE